MRRICLLLLVSVFVFAASSCMKKSVLSPDAFAEALDQTDREPYDDVTGLTEDLDNRRALAAGMFVQAGDSDIRDVMTDEEINGVYEALGKGIMSDMYSRDMDSATVFVCRDKTGDSSYYVIGGVASEFDSSDSASDYYDEMVSRYEEKDNTVSSDGDGINYTMITKPGNRNAACYAFYLDGKCVLALTGYESKTNAMADSFDEICGYMDIPSPDLEGIDCTKITPVENRVKVVADQLGARTVDIDDFRSFGMTDTGAFYASSDRPDSIKLGLDDLTGDLSAECRFVDVLYNISFNDKDISKVTGLSGYILLGYKMDDHDKAKKAYDSMIANIRKKNEALSEEQSGKDGDIDFFMAENSENYAKFRFAAFCENDRVYLVITECLGMDNAEETESEALAAMGF